VCDVSVLFGTQRICYEIYRRCLTGSRCARGNWHHVFGAYDGATVRLCVDGVEVGSGTPGKTIMAGLLLKELKAQRLSIAWADVSAWR
jgi:Concanavalin A-like lectin/glucanases superfamily